MKTSNLLQFVKETIKNNGGSFNLLTGELNPDSGYTVALKGREKKVHYPFAGVESVQLLELKNVENYFVHEIANYIAEHANLLLCNGMQDIYIGTWIDGDILYLDCSVIFDNLNTAFDKAHEWKQLAIFDNTKKVSISLTYDVYFNDDNSSNNKGFEYSFQDCLNYIEQYNGTNESYFADYKNGVVEIYCNELEAVVYSTEVK